MKIGFARRSSISEPSLFLSPPSGPGGQQVTLQGFGYQPDLNVFVQLGDSTVASARTDSLGSFTTRLYMPVTSEGDQPRVRGFMLWFAWCALSGAALALYFLHRFKKKDS